MKRFFSFGCSFTQYKWPTWADLIGKQADIYQNWGQTGAGNHFIFNSLLECDARNKLTSDDTVIIMWTNVLREDRFTHRWLCSGNILNQKRYSEEFVDKFVSIRGCYVRDLAFISAASKILKSIGCKYVFLSMVDMDNPFNYNDETKEDLDNRTDDVLDLYADVLKEIKPSIHKVVFNGKWNSKGNRSDYHPRPLEHLEYIKTVMPKFKIMKDTIKWAKWAEKQNEDYPGEFKWRLEKWQPKDRFGFGLK